MAILVACQLHAILVLTIRRQSVSNHARRDYKLAKFTETKGIKIRVMELGAKVYLPTESILS